MRGKNPDTANNNDRNPDTLKKPDTKKYPDPHLWTQPMHGTYIRWLLIKGCARMMKIGKNTRFVPALELIKSLILV